MITNGWLMNEEIADKRWKRESTQLPLVWTGLKKLMILFGKKALSKG